VSSVEAALETLALRAEVVRLKDKLSAQAAVLRIARTALAWWPTVCDRYPTLSAPWIGSLRLALEELDRLGGEKVSR
jgi:hypothetical protein